VKTAAVLLLLLMLPLPLMSQGEGDDRAVRAVVGGFVDGWNSHDAKRFAAVFAEDADFTNLRGDHVVGRAKIEEFLAPGYADFLKNSHIESNDIRTRFVRPDVAAVDVRWKLTGALDPQGKPQPDRSGLLSFVMAKSGGQWQIVVMHNVDLSAFLPPAK
jgi:uncharacterized protein (TIGR02246 family)